MSLEQERDQLLNAARRGNAEAQGKLPIIIESLRQAESSLAVAEATADAIEGDFRLTADGRIVCVHDADTKRVAGVNHVVVKTPLAELRTLDAGRWKAARFAGEYGAALEKLEEARRLHAGMRGLDYQFALTHLELEDYAAAEQSTQRSIERDEETSNAQALRGLILLEKARAAGAVSAEGPEILARLQESRLTDPLNPMPLYIMGEFYRADGKPELAVDAYRRALDRVSKTDSFLVTTVKAGLAGLRLNYRDGDPPLKLQDINGVLPPEQLFFGAADALLRGDRGAAAGYLREVRTRMPEEVFQALLQDSFFQDYLPPGILNDPQPSSPQP
jgi:tetratricopeptide (TPR) repeat protein